MQCFLLFLSLKHCQRMKRRSVITLFSSYTWSQYRLNIYRYYSLQHFNSQSYSLSVEACLESLAIIKEYYFEEIKSYNLLGQWFTHAFLVYWLRHAWFVILSLLLHKLSTYLDSCLLTHRASLHYDNIFIVFLFLIGWAFFTVHYYVIYRSILTDRWCIHGLNADFLQR